MRRRANTRVREAPVHPEARYRRDERTLDEERWLLIEAVLRGLSARDREVLTRFYVVGESSDQICAEMGLTETQLRLLKSRVMAKFEQLGRKAGARSGASGAAQTASRRTSLAVDRILPVVAHAVAVFGDEHKASHWLVTPLALLSDRSPAQVLAGEGNSHAVDQILTRIEHNIPS